MPPSKRDRDLISNILEDADTLGQRIEYFSVTKDSFLDDLSFQGDIIYDSLMLPT